MGPGGSLLLLRWKFLPIRSFPQIQKKVLKREKLSGKGDGGPRTGELKTSLAVCVSLLAYLTFITGFGRVGQVKAHRDVCLTCALKKYAHLLYEK